MTNHVSSSALSVSSVSSAFQSLRARSTHTSSLWRIVILFFCVIFLSSSLAAQEPSPRAKAIGKRMMCMCGCNQVLTECNHVGCSKSTEMLSKLEHRVSRGESDDLILQSFVQEYGEKVMTAPPGSGFGLVAWLLPPIALLLGFFVVRMYLLRWRQQPAAITVSGRSVSPELLDRARRDFDRSDHL